ncbi:ribonuclease H1 domain-containing protein [Shouchella clausii]|uniref:Ribonuclease H n=1 Tax=Shouchella clausii TaxID=79880 RepID=A0A268NVM4_SHOCL|nr:ribonuclease H family protein [Shouchella clausii]MDO7269858.1 ribonuclease H family protein [Shouchella clausii]MDO7289752.1 ribonuclease H family protein [Shouchella clausii]PAE87441.1 ribonuclease H [Shouchella clausii]
MAKQKYYVVWKGRKQGIFRSWADCEAQVKGYPQARFKSFPTLAEAEAAFQGQSMASSVRPKDKAQKSPVWDSVSVDVGSQGNPGKVEYKGVDTKTGEILFEKTPINMGTNNMGEFLAIVHGLAYVQGTDKPVYSDSATAIGWVKKKKANSTLSRTKETEEIWSLVERAEKWLRENPNHNPVLKWETDVWGEIKADYGRK